MRTRLAYLAPSQEAGAAQQIPQGSAQIPITGGGAGFAGDEQHVLALAQFVIHQTSRFAQAAAGAVSDNGVAQPLARDHTVAIVRQIIRKARE